MQNSSASPEYACPRCGTALSLRWRMCPECGATLDSTTIQIDRLAIERAMLAETTRLNRLPRVLPGSTNRRDYFAPHANAIVQVLPSGACIPLIMDQPVTLGRGYDESTTIHIDISQFHAFDHGVSRHHCRLYRSGDRLLVVDLGSANGTYLNDEPLLPHHEVTVADGDKLILGNLHLTISFITS